MARYRKQKKGSGLNPGESPADIGRKTAREAGEYVKSGIGKVMNIASQAVVKGGKKKYKKRRQRGGKIIASQTNEGLGGIPVGREFCDKDIKRGGGKNEFAGCGGDVFKGLYGGSRKKYKRSSRMRKTRRRRTKRKKSRRRRKSRRRSRRRSRRKRR